MISLKETFNIINEFIILDQPKIDKIEENILTANDFINDGNVIIIDTKEKNKNNYKILKIIGGATIGGICLGGISSIFGIIPGIIGASLGSSTTGLAIGIYNKFKN